MPILIDAIEQYQYGDNGLLLNGPAVLPFVDITSVQGLDSGDYRENEFARDGAHGSYIDAYFQAAKTVTLEGTLYADPNNMETFLDQLKANFAPALTDQPLYFKTDHSTDGDRLIFGKSLGLKYSKDQMRRVGSSSFQVQIRCGDPRVYGQALLSAQTAWTGGTTTLNLSGNRPSPGTMTLAGPLTNPAVTHTQSGAVFTFASYSLAAGQSIVIDLNRRTVLRGTTNERGAMTLTGNWPEFAAGTNTFTRTGSGTGTFTAVARSAWW